jgi:hypothetical protein
MELEPIFNKDYLKKQKEISDNIIMLEHQITSLNIKKALNEVFFASFSQVSYVISGLSVTFLIINYYLTNSFPTLSSNFSSIINLSTFCIYFLGICSTIFLFYKNIPFLKNIFNKFSPVKNLLKKLSHSKNIINIKQLEEKKTTLITQLESLREHEDSINSLFSNMTFKNKSIEEVEHLMAFAKFKKCMLEDDLVGATTIVTNYFSDKNIQNISLHI